MTTTSAAWLCIVSSVVLVGCSSSDSPSGPCAMTAFMSCTDSSSCHEFYSKEAAAAVTHDCTDLGQTIVYAPCTADFTQCCIDQNGSNGYPEGICLHAGDTSINECNKTGESICHR